MLNSKVSPIPIEVVRTTPTSSLPTSMLLGVLVLLMHTGLLSRNRQAVCVSDRYRNWI